MKYLVILLVLVGFTGSVFAFEPAYTNYFSNPEFQTYSIVEKNYKYDIPFHLSTGVLESMTMDCESTLLLLEIKTDNAGYITIHLPRVLIDSKSSISDEDDFIILLDDEETTFEETSDSVSRTLTIPFESDVTRVEIIGVNYPEHTGINACNEDHNPPYSYWFPPLKQSNSGIPINEIQCKQNLVLIQKYDGSPACVTESTKQKLIERGWTGSITESEYSILRDILDRCEEIQRTGTFDGFAYGSSWQNETHYIDNNSCRWIYLEKYLDENNELNFALKYDNNGMIIDDLQRIYDYCDYSGKKPDWYFSWNNQTHHIDSKQCKWYGM